MEKILSVVMPAYNEAETIREILLVVLNQPSVSEVIVVDDCSQDDTFTKLTEFAKSEPRVKVHRHPQNRGKGAALRTGIQNATSPFVIIQDADLEYDPQEYPKMIGPILRDKADAVFGSRFIGSEEHRVLYFWHSVGNSFFDPSFEHVHEFEPHGYGDLLQSFPAGVDTIHHSRGESFWLRAGSHRQISAERCPNLRGCDFISWSDLCAGEKNRLEGWGECHSLHFKIRFP